MHCRTPRRWGSRGVAHIPRATYAPGGSFVGHIVKEELDPVFAAMACCGTFPPLVNIGMGCAGHMAQPRAVVELSAVYAPNPGSTLSPTSSCKILT
jgi:hypothetical protein